MDNRNARPGPEALCALYRQYGYSRYKMSKFEEYDLYARNRDFLSPLGGAGGGPGVITFTDVNGKLMALKPDVTLSIVRHISAGGPGGRDAGGVVRRVFYDENVYRVSRRARAFREIPQTGLECIGAVDDYCVCEVLSLAAQSLALLSSGRWALDISHLGLLSPIIAGLEEGRRELVLKRVAEKNVHELARVCPGERGELLRALAGACGAPADVLPELRRLFAGDAGASACLDQMERVISGLGADEGGRVNIDFSVVSDLNYYNGVVFRGFIEGVPEGVLSGGQYDSLMRRVARDKDARAVGFAVYLDLLERLEGDGDYDVDAVLLYSEDDDLSSVRRAVEALARPGEGERRPRSVTAQRAVPEGLRFRRLLRLKGGEAVEEGC